MLLNGSFEVDPAAAHGCGLRLVGIFRLRLWCDLSFAGIRFPVDDKALVVGLTIKCEHPIR